MKRAVVIVGSPESEDPGELLLGVQADRTSYEAFFRSPFGGAWENDEIFNFQQPRAEDLLPVLQRLDVEFSITVFCGHGWTEDGAGPAICINTREHAFVKDFRTSAARQITIVDACRHVRRLLKFDEGRPKFGVDLGLGRADPYRQSCRALYDSAVLAAPSKRTVMFGCEMDQGAGEEPEGGWYSQALLGTATQWAENSRATGQPASSVLYVTDVHAAAKKKVHDEHFPQDSQITKHRDAQPFPFAVA